MTIKEKLSASAFLVRHDILREKANTHSLSHLQISLNEGVIKTLNYDLLPCRIGSSENSPTSLLGGTKSSS